MPSSTIIMIDTPTTGLVIDAMRNIVAGVIGCFDLEIHDALRREVRHLALARHDRHGAGEVAGGDAALRSSG